MTDEEVKEHLQKLLLGQTVDPMRELIDNYAKGLKASPPPRDLTGLQALDMLMPVFSAILNAQIDCASAIRSIDPAAARKPMLSIGIANDALNALAQAVGHGQGRNG